MKHLNLHIISTTEDNLSMVDGNGWVDSFARYLELVIGRMGWNDFISISVHTNDLENISIEKEDVLLAVISQSFLRSSYHSNYIESLIQKQQEEVEAPFQIMKIMKSPIAADNINTQLRSLFSYNFYYLDLYSGTLNEYKSAQEFEADEAFWMILVDLCYDILNKSEAGMKALGSGQSIFLAETGSDLQNEKHLIRRELKRYGYEVLPKSGIDITHSGLRNQMNRELPKCLFSIHLVGKDRGVITDEKLSVPEIQHSIASEFAHNGSSVSFKEIVWMQPNVHISNEQQKLFISDLQKDANSQDNIEIMQMRLEDFKSVILKQLEKGSKQEALNPQPLNGHKQPKSIAKVYLITDRRDFFASDHLAQWIKEQNIEVLQPNNSNQTTDRTTHIGYLNECDANLVFYKKATKYWLITKLQDIMKSPGLGREKPKGPLGVFVTSIEEQKEVEQIKASNPQYQEIQIISNIDGFPYKELAKFFEEIEHKEYERID